MTDIQKHLAQPENRILYLLHFDPSALGGWTTGEINARFFDLIAECDDSEAHF